jgi:hypothetical protein
MRQGRFDNGCSEKGRSVIGPQAPQQPVSYRWNHSCEIRIYRILSYNETYVIYRIFILDRILYVNFYFYYIRFLA